MINAVGPFELYTEGGEQVKIIVYTETGTQVCKRNTTCTCSRCFQKNEWGLFYIFHARRRGIVEREYSMAVKGNYSEEAWTGNRDPENWNGIESNKPRAGVTVSSHLSPKWSADSWVEWVSWLGWRFSWLRLSFPEEWSLRKSSIIRFDWNTRPDRNGVGKNGICYSRALSHTWTIVTLHGFVQQTGTRATISAIAFLWMAGPKGFGVCPSTTIPRVYTTAVRPVTLHRRCGGEWDKEPTHRRTIVTPSIEVRRRVPT